MHLPGLFFSFFSLRSWHGAISGGLVGPSNLNTTIRWIVGILILTMAAWIGWLLATMPHGVQISSTPTLVKIRQMSELVTAKVTVSDARVTSLNGYLGGVKVILLIHGDALLGPDLSQAKILSSNATAKVMVIELPRPHLISFRIDHSTTQVISLSVDGLWVLVPGDAGRSAVLNRAYAEAEEVIATAATTRETVNQAAEYARRSLDEIFSTDGWKIEVRWKGGE